MCAQPTGLLEVTVTDRWIPLVPAAYGTRVARPPGPALSPDGDGSQLDHRARPVCGDPPPRGQAANAARQRLPSRLSAGVLGDSILVHETDRPGCTRPKAGMTALMC
jgi:hypothetical protein